MEDSVVFICDNTTLEWILTELYGTKYSPQTEHARVLIDYTAIRKRVCPLFVTNSLYCRMQESLTKEQIGDITSTISTVPSAQADTQLNETLTLITLLKTQHKHEKIYLISNAVLPLDKEAKLRKEGIKEMFTIEQAANYLRQKPAMQHYIQGQQIHIEH